jgi:hypothetical protein
VLARQTGEPLAFKPPVTNFTMTAAALHLGLGKIRIQANVDIVQILGIIKPGYLIVTIETSLL